MNELKKQTVTIFDDKYTIVSDEPEELLSQAIASTNNLMASLSEQTGLVDKKKIAVLAVLQMALRARKLELQLQVFQNKEMELIASVNRQLA